MDIKEIVKTKVYNGNDLIINHCINYNCDYMDIDIQDDAIEFYQTNVGLFKRIPIEDVDEIEIIRHNEEGRIKENNLYTNKRK